MLPELVAERFEIRRRLGAGSFGAVYEAIDRHRHRDVALKVLERVAPDALSRFKREFRYLAEIRHPNLASLYELIVASDGRWLLSMELVNGIQLLEHLAFVELQNSFLQSRPDDSFDGDERIVFRRRQDKNTLSPFYLEQLRDTFRQLAKAISVLHAHGVIHRDLKPSNILITREGRVALLDFGLVAAISVDDATEPLIAGTPGYMSPEQITGDTVTPASDWYGFGALLYQALTGRQPYDAATFGELIDLVVSSDAPPAAQIVPGIPDDLANLADALLRHDPAARPGGEEIMRVLGVENFDPSRTGRSEKRPTEIIGRGRELRTLRWYVSAVRPGESQIIQLHGSAGSGKSALAGRLLDELRATSDPFIVSGRCHPWESVPFNAVDALVDSLARSLRREARRASLDVLGRAVAVTQLFPVLGGISFSRPLDDTVALPAAGPKLVSRAAAELRSLLVAAAGGRPVVLLLDDAQWGDYQSADILRTILQPTDGRVILLLVYRTEDRRTSLLLQALRSAEVRVRELSLKELSRSMTRQYLRRRLGRAGPRLTDRIFRETRGNVTLTGMIADVVAEGEVRSTWLLARAVAKRLEPLSLTAQRIFALLATRDEPVAEEFAEDELELFESDEALRALTRERLIRTRRTGDLREIDLYHDRIRQAVRGR